MKKIVLVLLSFLLVGCSYSLKTSLVEDTYEPAAKKDVSFDTCYGSKYCVWEAMNSIRTFDDYERYVQSEYYTDDLKWNSYIETRIRYAELTESSCENLTDPALQQRCAFALQFNQNVIDNCDTVEGGSPLELCRQQSLFSAPSVETCSVYQDGLKDTCLFILALVENENNHCGLIQDDVTQSRCRSFVANSLYFCTDRQCVEDYFNRNITRYPRLTYCNFDDAELQQYCEQKIRNWFALSRDSFLYCPSKECYGLLLDKKLYNDPLLTKDDLQTQACEHFEKEQSRLNCKSFVLDTMARVNYDIKLCKTFDCFEQFKGDENIVDERVCEGFQEDVLEETTDVFAGNQELSMCLSVIDYNRAFVAKDEDLCTTPDCLDAVKDAEVEILEIVEEEEVEDELQEDEELKEEEQAKILQYKVPSNVTNEEVKELLEEVDVEDALKSIDLNETIKNVDLNTLKDAVGGSELDGVDLNEAVENVDLNDAAGDVDLNEAVENINIAELLRQLEESKKEAATE